jgi:tetratricopeptide (TPR) repeat protein
MREDPVDAGRAMHLYRQGRIDAAEAAARQAAERNTDDVNARLVQGLVAIERGWFDDAALHFEQIRKRQPNDPQVHCLLARARIGQSRLDGALECYEQALQLAPGNPSAIRGKAGVLERQGELDRARAVLEPIALERPDDPETGLMFASLQQKMNEPEESIKTAHRCLRRENVQASTRRKLLYVLGKSYQRLGDVNQAFEAYDEANEAAGGEFDIGAKRDKTDRLIAAFSAERLAALPRAAQTSELPVFVVGMPRSGSTLIEQIIDAHPEATGAGELPAFNDDVLFAIPKKIGSSKRYPEWLDDLPDDSKALMRLGRPYLRSLAKHDRRAVRIVDKNLLNYHHLGLISLLYPKARVIHSHRDPLDVGLSCFINDLSPVGMPWSTDLRDIGLYYREYERLMDHWRGVVDTPLLEVKYEDLINDQEAWSRRIIEFCGLDWDDHCLRFHETGRAVATLSYDQVRRPMYRSAIKRWQRFEAHLDPLKEALGVESRRGVSNADRRAHPDGAG